MILLRLIKDGEIRLAVLALVVLLLVAATGSLVAGVNLIPSYYQAINGSRLDLRGSDAAAKPWPSSTPHSKPWPDPDSWQRRFENWTWHYDVRAPNPTSISGNGYSMDLRQTGWLIPVVESKKMWWDWDDPSLKGPDSDPGTHVLLGRLALMALLLGGGTWLTVFGLLAVFVLGRRGMRALRGKCAFCGHEMKGFCPECGWKSCNKSAGSPESEARIHDADNESSHISTIFFSQFIRRSELRMSLSVLLVLLAAAALGSMIAAVELLPVPSGRPKATTLYLQGEKAATTSWPLSTPDNSNWPAPSVWSRTTRTGMTKYAVRTAAPDDDNDIRYYMTLLQVGWPLPVIESSLISWPSGDQSDEKSSIRKNLHTLYSGLALNTLILGGGLWLVVFGPLAAFVVGRRVVWTLQGHCTFCGYDMTGFEQCPECGWRAKGST